MKPYEELEMAEAKQKLEQIYAEKKAKEENEKAAKEQAEAEKKEALAKEEAEKKAELEKGYNTGITFEQLARNPDDYLNKKVKFTGQVIQVMEGQNETQIRFNVNNNYKQTILCVIPKNLTSNNRILEKDKITISGISSGLYTYKSTLGGEITLPLVLVSIINN